MTSGPTLAATTKANPIPTRKTVRKEEEPPKEKPIGAGHAVEDTHHQEVTHFRAPKVVDLTKETPEDTRGGVTVAIVEIVATGKTFKKKEKYIIKSNKIGSAFLISHFMIIIVELLN